MLQVLRCDRCLNFIRDDNTVAYLPNVPEGSCFDYVYFCWQCWDKMSSEERKELNENSFIPPHVMELVDVEK